MSTTMSRTGREGHGGPGCAAWTEPASDFGAALRQLRVARGLQQDRLAEAAEFDHSYISRLERGSRMPTRDAVERLVAALRAGQIERRALLTAAGFAVDPIDPLLDELAAILADPDLPASRRQSIRDGLCTVRDSARRTSTEDGGA